MSMAVPRPELKQGEQKSLQTDRVILVPGPEEEVAWVGRMYRWLIDEDLSYRAISNRLNEAGVVTDRDRAPGPRRRSAQC